MRRWSMRMSAKASTSPLACLAACAAWRASTRNSVSCGRAGEPGSLPTGWAEAICISASACCAESAAGSMAETAALSAAESSAALLPASAFSLLTSCLRCSGFLLARNCSSRLSNSCALGGTTSGEVLGAPTAKTVTDKNENNNPASTWRRVMFPAGSNKVPNLAKREEQAAGDWFGFRGLYSWTLPSPARVFPQRILLKEERQSKDLSFR